MYDPNQNKYHDGGQILPNNITTSLSSSVTNVNHGTSNTQSPQSSPYHYHHQQQHHQQQQSQQQHLHHHLQMHASDRFSTGSASLNGMMINSNKSNGINVNSNGLSSGVLHPALLNIINEAQGMKFRGKSQALQIHYSSLDWVGGLNGNGLWCFGWQLMFIFLLASSVSFRTDRSFSDIQQKVRPFHQPPINSSSPRRRQILTTQSRI